MVGQRGLLIQHDHSNLVITTRRHLLSATASVRTLVAAAFLLIALVSLTAASTARAQQKPQLGPSPDHKVHYSHETMGTIVSLTMWTDNEAVAAKAAEKAFAEFARIDGLMSSWKDGSDVAAINAAAGGKPVVVSEEVASVIERAQTMARVSGGAFDITVGSYRGLWKFDQDRDGSIPSAKDVAKRRRLVGFRSVRLNSRKRTVGLAKKGQRITLGGIAKGYAVDRAVAGLHADGMVDFILQAGGDLYVSGNKGGTKWTVGIRDPRGQRADPFAVTQLENRTFSTSGDYERSVIVDGVRYHHLLDPKSGRPATGCRSVTVMAKDAITADIYSTALFVMGVKKGLALAKRTNGIEAVFVDADNKLHTTDGFRVVTSPPKDNPASGLLGLLYVIKQPSSGI